MAVCTGFKTGADRGFHVARRLVIADDTMLDAQCIEFSLRASCHWRKLSYIC